MNRCLKKFILNLYIILIISFIADSIILFFSNIFLGVNFKNILLLLVTGSMGGLAETFYIESQIKKSNLLAMLAFIFLLSSCGFYIFFDFDIVLVKEDASVFLMVLSSFCEGGLWMGTIIWGYMGILFMYIKLLRKDILKHDFKLLPYSIIYG